MLEPSVEGMLKVGRDCGLLMVEEAYNNYMHHYDMFFLIEDYTNQYIKFVQDLKEAKLLKKDMTLRHCLIEDALEGLERADTRSSNKEVTSEEGRRR